MDIKFLFLHISHPLVTEQKLQFTELQLQKSATSELNLSSLVSIHDARYAMLAAKEELLLTILFNYGPYMLPYQQAGQIVQ